MNDDLEPGDYAQWWAEVGCEEQQNEQGDDYGSDDSQG